MKKTTAFILYRRRVALLLCLILAMVLLAPAALGTQGSRGKVVRVGWYESTFHRTDQFGRRSGYGYEYQNRIATFAGWTYEYVEGSWPELLEMLIEGEIDLLSDVSYTEERAEKLLYSAREMGSEEYHVFVAPDNTEISPDDLTTFNGKRVGVNKSSVQAKLFSDWAKKHGVTPQITELTVKAPEMLKMLAHGEIDALVTLDAYGRTADVLPVCKIGAADFFFGVNRARPDIKQDLDLAMNRILEDNRYFDQQLAEKYNSSDGIIGFLTANELEWYNRHNTIRVGYHDDYLPFCDKDDDSGTLTGMLLDFLAFAKTCERNAELSFETVAFDSTDEGLQALTEGRIDCLFPVSLSAYDGEQLGVIITDQLVSTEVYAAVRTADRQGLSPERRMTVAITHGNSDFGSFLMDNFPNWTIAHYEQEKTGFEAVASEDADCVLVSNYRLNRMNDLCNQYRLSTLSTGETMDLSFAVRREDDCLYSILNKISHLIPDSTVNSSLTDHSFMDEKVTFDQFLRDNLLLVVSVLATIMLLIITLVLQNIRSERKASWERELISAVELDSLTQLYNQNFFFEYANRIHQRNPEPQMDAIVMNIEQFHSVNELNGREFGDQVLRVLGEEIRAFLSQTEGIGARFEADRFDIYCKPQEDYRALLARFQDRLDQLSKNTGIRLRMGVMPWHAGVEPMRLFDRARTACNRVRGSGRQLIVYDVEMQARENLNQRLINDLSRAIREREFKVYYQPKYDIQSEPPKLCSAEALIRWDHPELGLIPPDNFIPLFEHNGMISEIDKYVWQETARQIAQWRDQFGVALPVSVNLSRVDAFDPTLEQTLDGLVERFALERGFLSLEVTESAYTENAEQLCQIIHRLRQKGYGIEMDDFGSGYSSLNMLSSMPIDVLKMDRAFVQNIEHSEQDVRFVELILDIARNLKVPVIAEGVETPGQLAMLKRAGCAMVQGFYFSRPLPPEIFERLLINKRGNGDRSV